MSLPVSFAVQTALFGVLSSDVTLQGLLGAPARVYDAVPADPVFPFLTIGEVRTRSYAEHPAARAHEVRINAYSKWGGRKEIKELTDRSVLLLNGTDYPVEGQRLVQSRFVFSDIIRRNDPETYQAVMRFKIVTEEVGV